MKIKLSQIVAKLGGTLVGEDVTVSAIAATDVAAINQITFLTDKKYYKNIVDCQASAIIVDPKDCTLLDKYRPNMARIVTNNPYLYYSKVVALFHPKARLSLGIKDSAKIAPTALLGKDPSISDYVVIGENSQIGDNCQIYSGVVIADDVVIGSNVTIYANTVIYPNVKIGNNCILHSGVVVGSDGFGYASDEGKHWHKIPQVGGVIIADDVEIGANTTIDSGALLPTEIGHGVKIDNQVQIAHNVKIGAHTAIAACAGIAGGTTIGKHCQIGGRAGITGHIVIADYTVIGGASNVSKDITESGLYSSAIPVFAYKDWAKIMVYMRNWSLTNEKIKNLEDKLEQLITKE